MNARYLGDMSDAEWTVIAPFVRSAKFGGRPQLAAGRGRHERSYQRDFRSGFVGLPVAHVAQGISGLFHRPELFLPLAHLGAMTAHWR